VKTDERLNLRTVLGPYLHTQPLKVGEVVSDRLTLAHEHYDPVIRAFRPMANELAFDVSEMALVTYMLCRDLGRPIVGIPVVLMQQPELPALVCSASSTIRGPKDLMGRAIGVRAYTQTTGAWVRGILQASFDVDLSRLQWITLEAAHVDGYEEPQNVIRSHSNKSLLEMLTSGEVDSAVGIEGAARRPDMRTVIPDADRAEAAWAQRMGGHPINHILVVREELARGHPWLTHELMTLFEAARERALRLAAESDTGTIAFPAFGLEANRAAVQTLAQFAFDQKITRRLLSVEELFPEV